MKSKTYTQSKRPLDKNERSEFCQSSVKQTHFQNLKKKGSDFFDHRGTLNIALEREGKQIVITTRGNRIWSPIQIRIPPNRA